MMLPTFAGVMDLWERRARRKSSSRRRPGSMADDRMTLHTFAGIIDLLEKQEIGHSSAEGDTCKHGCLPHASSMDPGLRRDDDIQRTGRSSNSDNA